MYCKLQVNTWTMAFLERKGSSIRRRLEEFLGRKNIEEQCREEDLMNLHEAFLVGYREHSVTTGNEEMNETQLHVAFKEILKIFMSPEQFHVLFIKINLRKDGFVTWDEFISYLLLEFQEKDTALQRQTLEYPLIGYPEMLKTRHRCPICRILFCPEVLPDRTSSFLRGRYLSVSRDGAINYWSLDFEYERSVQSINPQLKVRPTVITDMIAMPDVQIVCTSSTERDLRFYDTVAKKFDLRVVITSLEDAVVCMSYYFSTNIKEDSHIVLGDMNGTVKVMSFSPVERGPFKHIPTRELIHLRYESLARGELEGLKVTDFKNIHSDWVSQVGYYGSLRAFISCSRCPELSLFLSDPTGTKMQYKFNVANGISCFNFCEEGHILITGGPDCIVRVWNPFVPKKASCVFQGHHAAICALVAQNGGKRIYSLSKDKCVKVWDVPAQACIQTYNNLPTELGEHTPRSVLYNTITHKMIIASMMIAILVCEKVINQETSDGYTHPKAVTCVLYNQLYKLVVTAGLDSCIIVWNPWNGRRQYVVTNAHEHVVYGLRVGVEITAACFDTSDQLLLTGARDGTLKMWNFNTGTCIRNMSIEAHCKAYFSNSEITSVTWLKNRILCTGWNRHVTEFADTETGIHRKSWETRHTEDVLCTAVRPLQVLATSSYNGELVLWRLETGQPYRRYQVSNPTGRYTISYNKELKEKFDTPSTKGLKLNTMRKPSSSKGFHLGMPSSSGLIKTSTHQQSALNITRTVAIHAMIFLTARPMEPDFGTLLVSLENGMIQVWTHHPAAGFLTSFSAIHAHGDYAMSLATDPENNFLITGHTIGYIKVWLLTNYIVPNPPKVCMPLLRLEFPFLWKDRINGRAKRAVRDQPLPLLLSSVQGHTKAITALQFVPVARVIISGSADHTVRLWTLGGRYISTLGTFQPWSTILPDIPVREYFNDHRLPPDIKRIVSYTSMKVLKGGEVETMAEGKADDGEFTKEVPEQDRHMLYGKRLFSPILGQNYSLPVRSRAYGSPPVLDSSLAYIPVYTHLITHDLQLIERPKTPPALAWHRTGMLNKMQTRKSVKIPLAASRDIKDRESETFSVRDSKLS